MKSLLLQNKFFQKCIPNNVWSIYLYFCLRTKPLLWFNYSMDILDKVYMDIIAILFICLRNISNVYNIKFILDYEGFSSLSCVFTFILILVLMNIFFLLNTFLILLHQYNLYYKSINYWLYFNWVCQDVKITNCFWTNREIWK